MGIFDRLKDGFDMSDIPGIISDLQKDGGVDLGSLMSGDFLKQFTNFSNMGDMLGKLGISDASQITELLQDKSKKAEADKVVDENSQFSDMAEMVKAALQKK
ncbi:MULTISPECIES: hypothetical protein [Enterococcus]|uniref:Uncharacterized protein n=1 Tax=Enterococcus diestrammenae TaxID=1155073 RepID=A0ABV0EZ53_9ENTE|nr:hypothetical protein [Enterococcus diestrammenae]KAF1294890.1 hypothetical protein BAU18_04110 [Enterococcus diestrammenae]HIX70016.1 hypothetical protein [Candidatus Enterococcus stercoravium]